MIVMLAAAAGGIAVVCVLAWGLLAAGLRAGDRPGDAAVAVTLDPGPRPVIIATVRNPGDVPLVAGLVVRRQRLPGWFWRWPDGAGAQADRPAEVPGRGAGHRGVVPAGDRPSSGWRPAPPGGRRYRLTAVIGQAGGRLRVIGVPVVSGGPAGAGRPAPAARAADRD